MRCGAAIDENIGKLLDYLKKSGLEENTIVIYTADQGYFLGEHGWFDKRFMYEESLRTPMLMRLPDRIKPGSVNENLVQNLDFAATFLDVTGIATAFGHGRSLVPLFDKKFHPDWRKYI